MISQTGCIQFLYHVLVGTHAWLRNDTSQFTPVDCPKPVVSEVFLESWFPLVSTVIGMQRWYFVSFYIMFFA
jgi:hypothetical protein